MHTRVYMCVLLKFSLHGTVVVEACTPHYAIVLPGVAEAKYRFNDTVRGTLTITLPWD